MRRGDLVIGVKLKAPARARAARGCGLRPAAAGDPGAHALMTEARGSGMRTTCLWALGGIECGTSGTGSDAEGMSDAIRGFAGAW